MLLLLLNEAVSISRLLVWHLRLILKNMSPEEQEPQFHRSKLEQWLESQMSSEEDVHVHLF